MDFLEPDGKRVILRGIPYEVSGSTTSKGMTTIFRNEDKTHTRKWSNPTHKTSRKKKWYAKGFSGRPPNNGRIIQAPPWMGEGLPITLQEAISRNLDLQYSMPENKMPQKPTNLPKNKEKYTNLPENMERIIP